MLLVRTPNVLIVHLKRFVKNIGRKYVTFNKINDYVDYPLTNWDLSQYCLNVNNEQPPIYDLIGVIHHYGRMGGGHYISTAYNSLKERWIKYDDERVSYASEDEIISSSAYVLFYQKRPANY